MRLMTGVALAIALMTTTAQAYPTLHLALRVSAQHTQIDKDDGAPDAWGGRYEISAGVQPTGLISFWAFAATSSYSASNLVCGVRRRTYSLDVSDDWIGVRVLLHPHPQLFLGLGYTQISTNESSDFGSDSFDNTSWEFIGGANLIQTAYGDVQAVLTFGHYDRFGNLEHASFLSIGAGVQF
ncbi:MAG: porin family protein [Deltaproteobacteria bacterium]|nr:MAG: porin family protein [Deltaproteobacteria bacterium]TMQ07742.1 MAG: porin family protein [Deltaproteobacteria bacterium]